MPEPPAVASASLRVCSDGHVVLDCAGVQVRVGEHLGRPRVLEVWPPDAVLDSVAAGPVRRCWYFGVWPGRSGSGHTLHACRPGGLVMESYYDSGGPPPLDGVYAPRQLRGGEPRGRAEAPQGEAILVHLRHWSILAFWDRTGDPRPGSNSAFCMEGETGFAELVATARAAFPRVWERLEKAGVEVRLGDGRK